MKNSKEITQAKMIVAQFYTAICSGQEPAKRLIQKSYLRDVAQQGLSKLHTSKIEALRNLKARSYKIEHTHRNGANMIQFSVVLKTRMGTFHCNPNAIKENNKWGINPVSALPHKEAVH